MKTSLQIDQAKKIHEWLKEPGITYKIIGDRLGIHPEAARSIYRRYQSDLTGEISVLSILDRERDPLLFRYTRSKEAMEYIDQKEKDVGYGDYLCLSDLHVPFEDVNAIKAAIADAKSRGIHKVIINGDLFHLDSASFFAVSKDQLAEIELNRVKEILQVIAHEFEVVYITEGNHDARLFKELIQKVRNGLKRFIQNISAIQTAIDELKAEEGITNIYYADGNELWLGNVLICHPDHYNSAPGRTVFDMIDTYLPEHRSLSAVIIGHTHYDLKRMYRGVAAFETGCLCYEPDYRTGAKKRKDIWTTAYGIFRIDKNGNLDYNNSHVIPVVGEKCG
ncbi:MAG: metallophosphoesterase [Bacteroidota bacterium]|nr:metallophosphoesterase [Bacteroidota bacterium]